MKNAVLLIHGTTGTGKEFLAKGFRDAMFEPGQPLDAAKYYLILPDAIGLGGSSKPSDGLHDRFPRYGYKDMVTDQKRTGFGLWKADFGGYFGQDVMTSHIAALGKIGTESERAERIEECSSGSFVGLGGFGKCALKFGLGHL